MLECDELGYGKHLDKASTKKARAGSRSRNDNSLGELTRKFVNLIRFSAEELTVDLNEAADKLGV